MLLDRIDIRGFKRLFSASTYVGRKTVALVGPNEAGKSSVLAALRLFDGDAAVDPRAFSRSDRERVRQPNEDVVVLWLALTADQNDSIAALPLEATPTHYRWHKQVDGQRRYSFWPAPRLKDGYRASVLKAWETLDAALRNAAEGDETVDPTQFADDLRSTAHLIETGRSDDDAVSRVADLINTLEASGPVRAVERSITAFRQYLEFEGPGRTVQRAIRSRIDISNPSFVEFGDRERTISAEYSLSNPDSDSSVALANLLHVAQMSLQTIRDNLTDPGYLQELLDGANDRLDRFFGERWSQEHVAVGLFVDGDILRVFVKDKREGSTGWMNITERSDGLRMFVALATFLARQAPEAPPILLIDEADQHLHLNAQADLVRMLQDLDQVQQVIYTTHSPGCLPTDLGNGVRFVEPVERGNSVIRHDFWSLQNEGHVGFNPLLMIMGAGAAAFSGLRQALVAEGASEMLLLPTLVRIATDSAELPYQVAPGIAVASQSDMRQLDLVASRVAFVVDGDDAGRDWLRQLQSAGVPAARIRSLPIDVAIEDLLDPHFYVATINDFFRLGSDQLPIIVGGCPIKSEVAAWASSRGLQMPGPISVAEQILGKHESRVRPIKLNSRYRRSLRALHSWALNALG